jgi:hypothetical protein
MGSSQRMKGVFVAVAVSLASAVSAAPIPEIHISPDNKNGGGIVGLCLLMTGKGTVQSVRIAKPSSDPILNKSAADYAKTLHWAKAGAPKKGWMPMNFTIGVPNDPSLPLPSCEGPTS